MKCPKCEADLIDATNTIYCPSESCDFYQGEPPTVQKMKVGLASMRDALTCWPLKEILSIARNSGNEQIVMLFTEVRDDALKGTLYNAIIHNPTDHAPSVALENATQPEKSK